MPDGGRLLACAVGFAPAIVAVPLLMALGFWQLQRAEARQELQASANRAGASAYATPGELAVLNRSHGRRMQLRGQFDNRHVWYLDNRIYKGRVGFEIIVPFHEESGWVLLVNRGFWEGTPQRNLPRVEPVVGLHTVSVSVYQPERMPIVLRPDPPATAWPILIQGVHMQTMWDTWTKRTAQDEGFTEDLLFPHLVRLDDQQVGARPASWHSEVPWLSVERHVGYAVTWFTMALVLLLLNSWHVYREHWR